MHIHTRVCVYIYIYIWPEFFLGGYETTPETGQVSYRFHTPIKNRAVSYPVSYPVEAVWFHTRFHTWFHTSRVTKALRPMESQGARKGICPTPAQRTPVRFHTGFIPVSYPVSYPSRPDQALPRFGSYAGRRFHTPVSYPGLAACGFIPWFHTGFIPPVSYPGFIPVSYRFHTVPKKRAVSYPLNKFWAICALPWSLSANIFRCRCP